MNSIFIDFRRDIGKTISRDITDEIAMKLQKDIEDEKMKRRDIYSKTTDL